MKYLFLVFTLLLTFTTHARFRDATCLNEWAKYENVDLGVFESVRGTCNQELDYKLLTIITNHHRPLSYSKAREVMFLRLFNESGKVRGVYSEEYVRVTNRIPDDTIMNTEHSWPRSKGAAHGAANTDLHHLYPTKSFINSKRSSHPFCNVDYVAWSYNGSKLGHTSQRGSLCFEPPHSIKGDIARGMLYFALRYRKSISSFYLALYSDWSRLDPVSPEEFWRNDEIQKAQGNLNPFVSYPFMIELVFGGR